MRLITPIPFVLALLLSGCATGGDAMQSSVDVLMRNYSGNVPGAAVLMLRDGEPLVRRGYGQADL